MNWKHFNSTWHFGGNEESREIIIETIVSMLNNIIINDLPEGMTVTELHNYYKSKIETIINEI